MGQPKTSFYAYPNKCMILVNLETWKNYDDFLVNNHDMIRGLSYNDPKAQLDVFKKLTDIFFGRSIKYWSISKEQYIETSVTNVQENYSKVPYNPLDDFTLVGNNYIIRFTSWTGEEQGYLLLNICPDLKEI